MAVRRIVLLSWWILLVLIAGNTPNIAVLVGKTMINIYNWIFGARNSCTNPGVSETMGKPNFIYKLYCRSLLFMFNRKTDGQEDVGMTLTWRDDDRERKSWHQQLGRGTEKSFCFDQSSEKLQFWNSTGYHGDDLYIYWSRISGSSWDESLMIWTFAGIFNSYHVLSNWWISRELLIFWEGPQITSPNRALIQL